MEYLEFTLDKFTFKVATDRLYHPDGLWVKAAGNRVTIGLSDFRQQTSGDIVFAEVTEVGASLAVGDEVAHIETIKIDISLPCPFSGVVMEVNPRLEMEAEIINQEPYGAGWLAVLEAVNWEVDRASLLEPNAYFVHMRTEAEEEIKKI